MKFATVAVLFLMHSLAFASPIALDSRAAASAAIARANHHRLAAAARVAQPVEQPVAKPKRSLSKRGKHCRPKSQSGSATSTLSAAAVVSTSATSTSTTSSAADPTSSSDPNGGLGGVEGSPTPATPAMPLATATSSAQDPPPAAPTTSSTPAPAPAPPTTTAAPASPTSVAPAPAPTTSAASTNPSDPTGILTGTKSGDGTYFDVGLGACGWTNVATDLVVAVSEILYDAYPGYVDGGNPNNNPVCGKTLTANYGGNSVTVTVVDRCTGCDEYSLDFSDTAFTALADMSIGRIHNVEWTWDS